jgi:hypothetical protein
MRIKYTVPAALAALALGLAACGGSGETASETADGHPKTVGDHPATKAAYRQIDACLSEQGLTSLLASYDPETGETGKLAVDGGAGDIYIYRDSAEAKKFKSAVDKQAVEDGYAVTRIVGLTVVATSPDLIDSYAACART